MLSYNEELLLFKESLSWSHLFEEMNSWTAKTFPCSSPT